MYNLFISIHVCLFACLYDKHFISEHVFGIMTYDDDILNNCLIDKFKLHEGLPDKN